MVVPNRHRWEKNRRHHHRCQCLRLPILAASVFTVVAFPSLLFELSYDNRSHRVFLPPEKRLRQAVPLSSNDAGSTGEQVVPFWRTPPKPNHVDNGAITNVTSAASKRYLIFRPPFETAQGVGNLMNGLLATHILGVEFDRIVCVSKDWRAFESAFESLVPECRRDQVERIPPRTSQNTIWLLNFSKNPINECDLKKKLQASDEPVIYFVANTYPGWPTTTTSINNKSSRSRNSIREDPTQNLYSISIENFYRLKRDLHNFIPWSEAPMTVVHLRQADSSENGGGDHRVGLDSATLAKLGALLPRETYLVTNQVNYYSYFETKFGWSHPPWTGAIRHSAIASVVWTSNNTSTELNREIPVDTAATAVAATGTSDQQTFQLWADWWTVYMAQTLYHTHSDFSASAVKWSRTVLNSYEIGGLDERTELVLKRQQQETWRFRETSDPRNNGTASVVLPLSERNDDLLKNCDVVVDSWKAKNIGLGYVLDLDDEMHDDLTDDLENKQQTEFVT